MSNEESKQTMPSDEVLGNASPRRDFLKLLLAGVGTEALMEESLQAQVGTSPFGVPKTSLTPRIQTDSDVGTLWPFVEKLATRAFSPLAYTQPGFRSLDHWKKVCRAKVMDLLHHTPPKWPAQGRTLEKIDKGGYILEKVQFNTSQHFRVPASVLVPKDAPRRGTPATFLRRSPGRIG